MPSQSELPGDIKRKKFIRTLMRLGFRINQVGGDGSHYKAIWKNEKSVTIPIKLQKQILYYILKEIEEISGVTWEEIHKNL